MFMSYFFSAKPEQENLGELKQELDVDFHKVWNLISVSILTFYQFYHLWPFWHFTNFTICVYFDILPILQYVAIFPFWHFACVQVSPAELCQRFGTNLETGLTSTQVLVARANIWWSLYWVVLFVCLLCFCSGSSHWHSSTTHISKEHQFFQAKANLVRDGPNKLTPPPTTPEWVSYQRARAQF